MSIVNWIKSKIEVPELTLQDIEYLKIESNRVKEEKLEDSVKESISLRINLRE